MRQAQMIVQLWSVYQGAVMMTVSLWLSYQHTILHQSFEMKTKEE